MSFPALEGTVECSLFCVLIFFNDDRKTVTGLMNCEKDGYQPYHCRADYLAAKRWHKSPARVWGRDVLHCIESINKYPTK